MAEQSHANLEASAEQVVYAKILEKGMLFGLAILFVTFTLYTFGIMKPYIPLDAISRYWGVNVSDYLHQTGIHPGWSWVFMLGYGDFINFIGIAILAGVTVICYLAIIPALLRKKDTVYAILALLEAMVLSLAASGILGSGGH